MFVGIIIALISIPIGMGYAQISGLPAIYGLYGSVLPILVFTLISSSSQFIFGVDAAPAALVGGVLMSMNISTGSEEAVRIVPVLTLYTAVWLLLFYIFKAGRFVNYISTPVMGGFITGIGTIIILMQIPKLMGSQSGSGELFELLEHLIEACMHINILSLLMGIVSLSLILISKKIAPKFPMSILVMILGALCQLFFNVEQYGVVLLSKVEGGLPKIIIPDLSAVHFKDGFMLSLPIAIVILAESLLSETNFAIKNNYKINENREILGFSLSNFSACILGCCPVNGSVSRTVMSEQYGAETKIVPITASIAMAVVLLFATGFIGYLPVPVLTAIVISALIGVLEIHVAVRLYKINKTEFIIFMGAFIAVIVLGTIYGVVIGLILSFSAMVLKSAVPPRSFLGVIPGKDGFYDLYRNRDAKEIHGTVIYRFNGSLFFANINTFVNDIEEEIDEDTKIVIVDAGGISSIDFTAADRLDMLYKKFKNMGISFYITEHIGELNDEMRKLDLGHLLEEGVVRRTIRAALREEGMLPPYPSEGKCVRKTHSKHRVIKEEILEEFEWAFGSEAEEQMEKHAKEIIRNITEFAENLTPDMDMNLQAKAWRHLDTYDADKLFEHLEMHLNEIAAALGQPVDAVEANILEHRIKLAEKMRNQNREFYDRYVEKRKRIEKLLEDENPKLYEYIMEHRKKQYELLVEHNPEIKEICNDLIVHYKTSVNK
ncbi:SulP family inorganic anion transporter [uncultured Clostridium sp.]|uniref:SulP family inorganic anion transporter n=1 Tax=uncultured Clostridium sp. TaxID=59620 RepID=UPI00345D08B8